MIILDENIREDQRQLLRSWRIRARQIAYDIGNKGIRDDAIIPFLQGLNRPVFLTRDAGFFQRRLIHSDYCLVVFGVGEREFARFVRRFMHHPSFRTERKRMGNVVRVAYDGVRFWPLHAETEQSVAWPA